MWKNCHFVEIILASKDKAIEGKFTVTLIFDKIKKKTYFGHDATRQSLLKKKCFIRAQNPVAGSVGLRLSNDSHHFLFAPHYLSL
jgi:hypothetical protein